MWQDYIVALVVSSAGLAPRLTQPQPLTRFDAQQERLRLSLACCLVSILDGLTYILLPMSKQESKVMPE
jgi:hypothetical protein